MQIQDLYGREFNCYENGKVFSINPFNEHSVKVSWVNGEEEESTIIYENEEVLNYIYTKSWTLLDNKPKFEHLEEIEVSNCKMGWTKVKYIGLSTQGHYVVEFKNNATSSFLHARKINHERVEALKQIKKLMAQHKIEVTDI